MATAPAFPIPAVWLRLPAFAVDLLLLYLLGWLLCRIPGVAFDQLGALARVAGFTAACLYFALTEALTGCSPGQRLFGLRCVSADGRPLRTGQSFLRACLFGLPWFCSGFQLPLPGDAFAARLMQGLTLAGLGANVYLWLLNRPAHRGYHEILSNTVVVRRVADTPCLTLPAFSGRHMKVLTGWLLLSGAAPFLLRWDSSELPETSVSRAQQVMLDFSQVRYAGISEGTGVRPSRQTDRLTLKVILKENRVLSSGLALKLAKAVVARVPEMAYRDLVEVELIYGTDLGIYSRYDRELYYFDAHLLLQTPAQ